MRIETKTLKTVVLENEEVDSLYSILKRISKGNEIVDSTTYSMYLKLKGYYPPEKD
jgi:hypothetical protein